MASHESSDLVTNLSSCVKRNVHNLKTSLTVSQVFICKDVHIALRCDLAGLTVKCLHWTLDQLACFFFLSLRCVLGKDT